MAEAWTEDRLISVLGSIGAHLDVPERLEPWSIDQVRTGRTSRWSRRLLVAAVVAAVVLLATLTIAPVRHAVARWLGIGSTSIEQVPSLPVPPSDLPGFLDAVRPLSTDEAEATLGGPLPVVPALGAPDLIAQPPEGGVVMAWAEHGVTLWVHRTNDTPLVMKKIVQSGARARFIPGLGDESLAIEGAHVFESPIRRVGAASTVLWAVDGVEYRLEGDLAMDELVRVARAVSQ